ncbi:MAG: ComF family protein [Chitinophagaceae bacterium]|jgi:ComF family protein|nr:ComF family protein [Chitinophagaceae bacterium]
MIKKYLSDFLNLFFPVYCVACGENIPDKKIPLCTLCYSRLPETNFFTIDNNSVEKIFYGRLPVIHAGSAYFYSKDSIVQKLIYALKYRGDKNCGIYLGKLMAVELEKASWIKEINALVPIPLNKKREQQRGYNQAKLIADGIKEVLQIPVLENAVVRKQFTETQTHKTRAQRQQNMEDVFMVENADLLNGKHILLIDDIVTTGATLDACGNAIVKNSTAKLSIATVAMSV